MAGLEGSLRQPRAGSGWSGEPEEDSWWQPPCVGLPPRADSVESVHLPEEKTWKHCCGEGREDDDRPTGLNENADW